MNTSPLEAIDELIEEHRALDRQIAKLESHRFQVQLALLSVAKGDSADTRHVYGKKFWARFHWKVGGRKLADLLKIWRDFPACRARFLRISGLEVSKGAMTSASLSEIERRCRDAIQALPVESPDGPTVTTGELQ